MLNATKNKILPTTIIGSLPRPSWYTENLGTRSFLDAMVNSRYREQYTDALSVYLTDQTLAGLDICTDGDCRFDQDVGGQSWTSYPPHHMSGFEHSHPQLARAGAGGIAFPRGHILHDYLEARVMPKIVGPIGASVYNSPRPAPKQRSDTRPPGVIAVASLYGYDRTIPRPSCFGGFLSEAIGILSPFSGFSVSGSAAKAVEVGGDVQSGYYFNRALVHAASRSLTYPNKSSIFRGLLKKSGRGTGAGFWGSIVLAESVALYNENQASATGQCQ